MVIIDIETVTFFKAIVIKIGLLESHIVEERHFKTREEATRFQMHTILDHDDMVCHVYQM